MPRQSAGMFADRTAFLADEAPAAKVTSLRDVQGSPLASDRSS
jgi:hypothetical protein